MNISDCIFTEKDIKRLQDCRDSQKDIRLKLRFIAILSVSSNTDGIEAGIEQTAENILKLLKIGSVSILPEARKN